MAFIDYEKAFDSIHTSSMIEAITNQGVDQPTVDTLAHMYNMATSRIKMHEKSDPFRIGKGVRQGDTISPKLFTATLEESFRKIDWNGAGIAIDDKILTNLRYADDVAKFGSNAAALQTSLDRGNEETKKIGLKMNIGKCGVMFNQFCTEGPIEVEGRTMEKINKFVYLGQEINAKGDFDGEISRRIKLSWAAFNKFRSIFLSKIPLCLKRKLFDQCILPVMTYGCQTWVLTQAQLRRLQVTQRKMERLMLGITIMDKIRNASIREKTRITDVAAHCKRLKWKFAGSIARSPEKWAADVLNWKPDGKRRRGRPKPRWEDEIVKLAGENWKNKAQDKMAWSKLGETFVQQWTDNTSRNSNVQFLNTCGSAPN
jgi:hypothetical protein